MELNERKLRVLKAVIDDYIATAMPVGSRTLMKKYMSELSAATIRNEMSDLEEMGFLDSPHTSAGRVPSNKAYRYYVDKIIRSGEINEDEQKIINGYFSHRIGEVGDVIKNAAKVVSKMTDYASVAISPNVSNLLLRRIQLVPVVRGAALVVIVTDGIILKDEVVRVPEQMTSQELSNLSEALSRRFEGRPLKELSQYAFQDMETEMESQKRFFTELTSILSRSAEADTTSVVVDGALNIFHHPEYLNDTQKAQSFLSTLSSTDKIYDLLNKATQWEFTITIGAENPYVEMKDMSVVTATYKIGDQPLGSVGVIGPTRMDYERVLRILNGMGRSMGEILSTLLENEYKD